MPANPVNAVETVARVVLVAPGQIWLRGAEGEIMRAWAPRDAIDEMVEDVEVHVYLDGDDRLNGWWDRRSGLAVNQRGLAGRDRPDHGVPLTCLGSCGLIWEAPAAASLMAADERCLTCCGPLSTA